MSYGKRQRNSSLSLVSFPQKRGSRGLKCLDPCFRRDDEHGLKAMTTESRDFMKKDKWHHALLINAFVFPGAGYFAIGKKGRGIIVVIATLYFLIMPIVRYTHTVMKLMSPTTARDVLDPTTYTAFSVSWQMHHSLIIWSLASIVILWIVSLIDIYVSMKQAEKKTEESDGLHQ